MLGLLRSLLVYYGIPFRHQRLKSFYRPFRAFGSLMFDVGAHLGNRSRAWLALGGSVVAVEPQKSCLTILRWLYGRNRRMEIVPVAVAESEGILELHVSSTHPTMTTTAGAWISELEESGMSRGVRWDRKTQVPVTTLDRLIGQFGAPAFVKIDVEGAEQQVLDGLSRAVPLVSFEYFPTQMDRALACIARLSTLGEYRFNYCIGERRRFALAEWRSEQEMSLLLSKMSPKSRSGDVYARLASVE